MSSQPILGRTRRISRRDAGSSHPPSIASSSAFADLNTSPPPASTRIPRHGFTALEHILPAIPHPAGGGRDPPPSDASRLQRAIDAVEDCPVGSLDRLLNLPPIRNRYQIRPILTVSGNGKTSFHLLPPLNKRETRHLHNGPPKRASETLSGDEPPSKRRMTTSTATDKSKMLSHNVAESSSDDNGNVTDGTVPEGDDEEEELQESDDTDGDGRDEDRNELDSDGTEPRSTSDDLRHHAASRTLQTTLDSVVLRPDHGAYPLSASNTTVTSPRLRTIDGSAEPVDQHAHEPPTKEYLEIDRTLLEIAEMVLENETEGGPDKVSWAQREPEEYHRLSLALRGSRDSHPHNIAMMFSLSHQIADSSVMEVLCRQIVIRRSQTITADPPTENGPPYLPPRLPAQDALVKRAPTALQHPSRTVQEEAMSLLGCSTLPHLYQRLLAMDQSRWYNALTTRAGLSVLAIVLEQKHEEIQSASVPGRGQQGKAYMSRAKDALWQQIFPEQQRTDARHASERRAFDRRIAQGRQWRRMILRFGWAFLLFVPVSFPDSWFEKNLQHAATLEAFMDHLARSKRMLNRMCQRGAILLPALLGQPLPEDLPDDPADLEAWLLCPDDASIVRSQTS